jgi:hypothetical protein
MAPAIAAAASGRGGRRSLPLGRGGRTAGRPARGSAAVPTAATLGRRGLAAVRRVVVVAVVSAVEAAVGDFDFEPRVAEARSVCVGQRFSRFNLHFSTSLIFFRINFYSDGGEEGLIDKIS